MGIDERPITRLLTWGPGWGMLFGEPEHPFFGEPMEMIGPPPGWPEEFTGKVATNDNDIFEAVKQHRKGK